VEEWTRLSAVSSGNGTANRKKSRSEKAVTVLLPASRSRCSRLLEARLNHRAGYHLWTSRARASGRVEIFLCYRHPLEYRVWHSMCSQWVQCAELFEYVVWCTRYKKQPRPTTWSQSISARTTSVQSPQKQCQSRARVEIRLCAQAPRPSSP
jgi:hypothetical protein